MYSVPVYMVTSPDIVAIVCDADHWTRVRAAGGTVRERQFVIDAQWLDTVPFVVDGSQ